MDLDAVADELYGLPPEQFVAVRTEREKQARSAGDRQLAAAIRQLGKPTAVAWLANQLVRARRTEIEPLLELGAGLRAASATLDGAALRELDKQQHQLVHLLVQHARRLAAAAGRPVSEDTARGLESTLHAALADSDAADLLAGGRLTDALTRRSGFPPADIEPAGSEPTDRGPAGSEPADRGPRLTLMPTGRAARTDAALRTSLTRSDTPKKGSSKAQRADRDHAAAAAEKAENERRAAERRAAERRAAALELARRAEQRAQALARDAAEVRDRAHSAVDRADTAAHEAAATVDRLRAELDAAVAESSRMEHELIRSRAELEAATEAAAQAGRRFDEAAERRRLLSS